MSNFDTTTTDNRPSIGNGASRTSHTATRRISSETKASFKTTELIAYLTGQAPEGHRHLGDQRPRAQPCR